MRRWFQNLLRPNAARGGQIARRRLRLEHLESRDLLMGISVTSNMDDGSGGVTLREAILLANDIYDGQDIITIESNVTQIMLSNELPLIEEGVTITTRGQTVTINCTNATGEVHGLKTEIVADNDSDDVVFNNLKIYNADHAAFWFGGSGLDNVTMTNCKVDGILARAASEGIYISADNVTSIEISGCELKGKQGGIWNEGYARTLSIHNNDISSWGEEEPNWDWYGIRCWGVGNDGKGSVQIANNDIDDIPGYGIYLDGADGVDNTALQTQITGNEIGVNGPVALDGIHALDWRGDLAPGTGARISSFENNIITNCEAREKPCRTWRVGEVSQAA